MFEVGFTCAVVNLSVKTTQKRVKTFYHVGTWGVTIP